ncbi:cysteine desulfurase family protein [Azospirillum oleiclasticum]|uniref:cysteine desulfurase family protein n=1 Tax=Azospirillum oleiclasticum TaxID=2735135 RepID=UPI0031B5998B
MTDNAVYLDHNATTPVDPAVLDAMLPFLRGEFGNPSSAYPLGRRAHDAVEAARAAVAALIGAAPDEILFTGGGTESSNHAIRGAAAMAPPERRRIVTTTVEHPATEKPCRRLTAAGFSVERLPVDGTGRVALDAAERLIDAGTALVTAIHAQNELGTLQPITELATLARRHGALCHADAAQSLGKVPVDVAALGVDLLTIAGHKLYAPKGVGALYVRRGVRLDPLVDGAGQEGGRRPGTENVPYIVGLGTACRLAAGRLAEEAVRLDALRGDLQWRLADAVPGLRVLGHPTDRLPNTLSLLFPGVHGNDVLAAAPEVMASTGSACHAGDPQPSAVLLAMGIPPAEALGAVRLSLGRLTGPAEVERAAAALAAAWRSCRGG